MRDEASRRRSGGRGGDGVWSGGRNPGKTSGPGGPAHRENARTRERRATGRGVRTAKNAPCPPYSPASILESAIQTLRRIPRSMRSLHDVDRRIEDLHKQMRGHGKQALDEMGTVKSGPIDLSQLVEDSRAAVRGKPVDEALVALARVSTPIAVAQERRFAEKMVAEHPFQHLFGASHLSSDGRVVAKTSERTLGIRAPQSTRWRCGSR